jgi:hypothetical protein
MNLAIGDHRRNLFPPAGATSSHLQAGLQKQLQQGIVAPRQALATRFVPRPRVRSQRGTVIPPSASVPHS